MVLPKFLQIDHFSKLTALCNLVHVIGKKFSWTHGNVYARVYSYVLHKLSVQLLVKALKVDKMANIFS